MRSYCTQWRRRSLRLENGLRAQQVELWSSRPETGKSAGMIEGWSVVALALGYVSSLFALAWYRRQHVPVAQGWRRPAADLCPLAGRLLHVLDVLRQRRPCRLDRLRFHPRLSRPDPAVCASAGRYLLRIVRLAKSQNITSVADFLAARYGKSQAVAAHRHRHRGRRHAALHRPAVEGGRGLGRARCSAPFRCRSRSC